jgi:tubulin polyglutamylase TTLL6/13
MPGLRGSRCFEILGFDIMIDSKLRPWLIEVNHLPSFGTDSPLDLDIKARLMASKPHLTRMLLNSNPAASRAALHQGRERGGREEGEKRERRGREEGEKG